MNIEKEIIQYLSDEMPEIPVYADVPNPRPDTMVSIERTGGVSDSIVIDRPQISIMCWAPSRLEASELAYRVDKIIRDWDNLHVVDIERSGLFNFPDADGSPRYQITLEGTTYLP